MGEVQTLIANEACRTETRSPVAKRRLGQPGEWMPIEMDQPLPLAAADQHLQALGRHEHLEGLDPLDADAQHAKADAKSEHFHIEKFARAVEAILDDAKDDKESHQRALGTLQGAMDINNQTTMAAGAVAMRG